MKWNIRRPPSRRVYQANWYIWNVLHSDTFNSCCNIHQQQSALRITSNKQPSHCWTYSFFPRNINKREKDAKVEKKRRTERGEEGLRALQRGWSKTSNIVAISSKVTRDTLHSIVTLHEFVPHEALALKLERDWEVGYCSLFTHNPSTALLYALLLPCPGLSCPALPYYPHLKLQIIADQQISSPSAPHTPV